MSNSRSKKNTEEAEETAVAVKPVKSAKPKKEDRRPDNLRKLQSLYDRRIAGEFATQTATKEITMCCIEMMLLPEIDTRNAEQVLERTTQYFKIISKYNVKPTLESYGLSMHIPRTTLIDIVTGRISRPPDVHRIITGAHMAITAMMAGYMTDNQVNPVAGIFLMKNNMGYTNDENGMTIAAPEQSDEKSIEEKYEHLLDE